MGLRVTHNAYFLLLTHTKQLLLVTICDATAGIGSIFWVAGQRTGEGKTDVMVEKVI